MSAHVVPKIHPFPDADEEEKTTIEDGWEDEGSTTVEQGEVQDKIRQAVAEPQPAAARRAAMFAPSTGITSTNAGQLDELTVDDRGGAALPLLPPVMPLGSGLDRTNAARLVVTAGNDTGQELVIRPGKTYTIGRAIDNDLVLTDIAVSRKHFDLMFDADGWVVADRGSGNGTVVNGNIEDQPFVLATGDLIEIGNTVFRFEAPNATPPPRDPRDFDVDVDEEPSTVAGRQPPKVREPAASAAPPPQVAPYVPPASAPLTLRPKTQPPPPLPARSGKSAPPPYAPLAAPLQARNPITQPPPMGPAPLTLPSTLPGAPMPTAHGSAPPMNQQQMLQHLVTTAQVRPLSAPMPYGYPNASDLSHQHAPMQRDATSTALVPPTPYNGVPIHSTPPTQTGIGLQLTRRTKMILAGAGLAFLAAVVTIAVVKGGEPELPAPPSVPEAKAVVEPKVEPKVEPTIAPRIEPKVEAKVEPTIAPKAETPKIEAPKIVEAPKPEPKKVVETPKPEPKPEPKKVVETPKPEPKKVVETPKPEPKKVVETPKPEPKTEPKPKTVAVREPTTSNHADLSPVKSKASDQFRAKNFTGAAATLRAAAANVGSADAKELKALASTYEQFGRAYNTGMAPGTKPPEAYQALKTAKGFDSEGAFQGEIKSKLGEVAAKAAGLYIVRGEYEAAFAALTDAEAYGGSNSNTAFIRKNLEAKANDLYNQAAKEMSSDPDDAKAKLTTVTKMVARTSPLYTKAKKLLGS